MPVLDYQVSAGANDGRWYGTAYSNSASYNGFGSVVSKIMNSFARWPSVTIPSGARITSAYVSLYFGANVGTPPTCKLYFEKTANPLAISSASNGDGRTKTTANINIVSPGAETWYNSNDISAIIQELIDAYSYASGAAMQMIIIGAGTGDNYSNPESCDYNSLHAPKLHIEYSMGGVGLIGDGLVGDQVFFGCEKFFG